MHEVVPWQRHVIERSYRLLNNCEWLSSRGEDLRSKWAVENSSEPRRITMIVEVQVIINGSKEAIWAAITNIENAADIVSGIMKIEIVEKKNGQRARRTPLARDANAIRQADRRGEVDHGCDAERVLYDQSGRQRICILNDPANIRERRRHDVDEHA